LASSKRVEDYLSDLVRTQVEDTKGLEGGFYLLVLDEFIGYAYPTSEPPVPAYGPPPRSYHIIREQALASIEMNKALSDLHAFDPAVFPLATRPFKVGGNIGFRKNTPRGTICFMTLPLIHETNRTHGD
jgi:hypothetical protein